MLNFKRSLVQMIVLIAWFRECCTFSGVYLWYVLASSLWVCVILTILMYDHDYWVNKGIFSPPAWPLVGHIWKMAAFKEQSGMFFKRIYDLYKDKKIIGIHQFFRRTVVVCDPGLIKRICVNDFQYFTDRGFFFDKELDPLVESVLYMRGNEWKALRSKISPIFSPIKLKGMLPIVDNIASEFAERLKKLVIENGKNTEIKEKDNKTSSDERCCGFIGNEDKSNKTRDDQLTLVNCSKLLSIENLENDYKNISDDLSKEYTENIDKGCETKDEIIKEVVNCDKICGKGVEKDIKEFSDDRCNRFVESVNNIDKTKNEKLKTVVSCDKLFGGYTADAIVPCAFGVKSHVMDNANDPFAVALGTYYEMSFFNILGKSLHYFWPALALLLKIRIIPKKTHEFFVNIVTNVIKERNKGALERRGDFIDMMMALQSDEKNQNAEEKETDIQISDMIISANAFIVFLGGFETTTSTLSFLLLELADHPEVQEKLRREIDEVYRKHQGKISHEMLQDLTYMDMVIQETLRLYPPFPSIQRECTRDYTIPETGVTVQRGTLVLFPTLGLQRDEQYFEKALAFIPERWSEEKPQPPPGVFMPFGDGPRYCIGKRFALIQMKCCLIKLLRRVRVSPAPKADSRMPNRTQPRQEPFSADLLSPMTLHPADARVILTLL